MAEGLKIVFNLLPEVKAAMRTETAAAVARTANWLADTIAATAPYKSGFLAGSVYYKTARKSTYGQGTVPPPGDSYLLPEVDKPPDNLSAVVAVGADYGAFVNYGTSRMAAQPFVEPQVAPAQERLLAEMEYIENNLHRMLGGNVAADEGSY